jgi:hypothetical protein
MAKSVKRILFHSFGIAAVCGALAAGASAQASKPKAKPLATPPVLSPAEIISRADDYVEPRTVETSISKSVASAELSDSETIKKLNERIKTLESSKGTQKADKDENQKRLLLNLDILTRAEQRSESLRKQVFEMIEKENSVKGRLDQIEIEMRPEAIERALQLQGSMKPEEVRENRRRTLDAERRNLTSLLLDIQGTRANLSSNLLKADTMVEKIRTKLERDIDDTFLKDDPIENL